MGRKRLAVNDVAFFDFYMLSLWLNRFYKRELHETRRY